MATGMIFKIKKYAIHDGPGIRTTVFLKGCPLSCWWCHNPEGRAFEPQVLKAVDGQSFKDETAGQKVSADEIIQEIEKDTIFYDESNGGATFSGGEPLSQPDFLMALLKKCRDREIHTAIDTTGFAAPDVFENAVNLANLVLFDLKLVDEAAHQRFTGVSNKIISQNLDLAAASKTPLRIRVPIIPGITDTRDNIKAISHHLRSLPDVNRIDILPFHRIAEKKYERLGMVNKMTDYRPPTQKTMDEIKDIFESSGFKVHIGG